MKTLCKVFVLSFVLVVCGIMNSQTAHVIALSGAEASEMKDLQSQKLVIEEKISKLNAAITKKYMSGNIPCITVGSSDGSSEQRCVVSPWQYGFDFSTDYKYVVPKNQPVYTPTWWNSNTGTFAVPTAVH